MILCMHVAGLIPFKSAIVHPIAPLYLESTFSNASSCGPVKSLEIITGKLSLEPKKEYLRCEGRVLSSRVGGLSKDGFNGSLIYVGNGSNW